MVQPNLNPGHSSATAAAVPAPVQSTSDAKATGVPIDALYYYAISELDQRPLLKRLPELMEEPAGVRLAVNGTARIELLIENSGRVNAVNILMTDLPDMYIRELERAFSEIGYEPGRKLGSPARARLYIEVTYVDGVLNNLPIPNPNLGVFPPAKPHTPIQLSPDRHKKKVNPPLAGKDG